jgi:hypothetical protein
MPRSYMYDLHMRALCPAHLTVLILITLISFYKKKKNAAYWVPHSAILTLLLFLSNVLVSTLFPNAESEEEMLNLYQVKMAVALKLIFFSTLSRYIS